MGLISDIIADEKLTNPAAQVETPPAEPQGQAEQQAAPETPLPTVETPQPEAKPDVTGEKPDPDKAPKPQGDGKPEPAKGEPPSSDDAKTVPLSALEDERKKRQDWKGRAERAEGERDAYEGKIGQLQQRLQQVEAQLRNPQPNAAPAAADGQAQPQGYPDIFQDPEGYVRSIDQRMGTLAIKTKLDLSEAMVVQQFPDFAEVIPTFMQLAEANPRLKQVMVESPHPALFAYNLAKQAKASQEIIQDPSKWIKKEDLEAEVERRIAERQAQQPALATPVESSAPFAPPPSLATARSAAPRAAPTWDASQPITALFNRR